MKSLMIVAAPRTGTNYLINLLSFDPGFKVFHEAFHPHESYGFDTACVRAFAARTQAVDRDAGPKDLPAAVRAYPEAALEAMTVSAKADGASTLVFKVFPGHLHMDGMRRLLARVNAVLFVKRPVLETYISVVKALKVGAFYGVDTTDVRPELDPTYFRDWYGWTQAWYLDNALAWMSQHGSSELPVARFHEFTDAGSDAGNFAALRELLARRCDVELRAPETPIVDAIGRQDRGGPLAARVRNHEAFLSALGNDRMRRTLDGYF